MQESRRNIFNTLLRTAIALLLLGWFCTAYSAVYRWTDENGVVHFGQAPPLKEQAVQLDIGSEATKPKLEDIIRGTWYAKRNGGIIEFKISEWTNSRLFYTWQLKKNGGSTGFLNGYIQQGPTVLQLESLEGAPQRSFSWQVGSDTEILLIDVKTEQNYRFKTAGPERIDLTERETFLTGVWEEVNPARPNVPVYMIEFNGGTFTRYRHQRGSMRFRRPNPNFQNTTGNWRIEGETLVMDYVQAYDHLHEYALSTQRAMIVKLEHRKLILRQEDGRLLHFQRERTR